MIVYKATNKTNGRSYVGFTGRGLKRRIKEHIKGAQRSSINCFFWNAIKKNGKENFIWEILWEGEGEKRAKNIEIIMIQEHKTLVPNGYNMTTGGDGGIPCEEVRQKMSMAKQGERNPLWGKHHAKETRQKMSKTHAKKKLTKENCRKISLTKRGENHPSSKLIEAQVLEIYQRVWAGEKELNLAKEFGISRGMVSNIKHCRRWKHILPKEQRCAEIRI